MGDAGFFALFVMVAAVGVSFFAGPVGQAIGRRIAGEKKRSDGGLTTGEMAAERLAHLEQRVQELEERLDFAERMLTKIPDEPPAIGEGTRS